jgi:hypothetical protein
MIAASFVGMPSISRVRAVENNAKKTLTKSEWMAAWMNSESAKDAVGDFWLGRFLDEMYFLLKPIAWKPNANQADDFQPVEVPAGFVTDLASIPWPLWSLLRPDGQYAFAAVVHDYLYWMQKRPRYVADKILKFGMEDLKVGTATKNAIYAGVRLGGRSAWDENKSLRLQGERRVLKRCPTGPTTYWKDWKAQPDVFAATDDCIQCNVPAIACPLGG